MSCSTAEVMSIKFCYFMVASGQHAIGEGSEPRRGKEGTLFQNRQKKGR
jgi:hypothetical protein